jgi:uncharacterized protein (TIGR02145 family)
MKKIKFIPVICVLLALNLSSCSKESPTGNDHSIIIEEFDPITDIDGNVYKTKKIGDQIWMVENLNVSHFRNGDPVPEARTKAEWELAGNEHKPAWCYYNNDSANAKKYGKLYNWYAINDPRGLGPAGWHAPNNKEWGEFIDYLGGSNEAGTKMKSSTGWGSTGNGDNSGGFTGLPGGGRLVNGTFVDVGTAGIWWGSSEISTSAAYGYNLNKSDGSVLRGIFNKATGLSVRCIYCSSDSSDTTSAGTLPEKLQQALDDALNTSNGKGVSAAVILPDGQTWTGGSGISYGTTAITPAMRFSAGSIAKLFTATTILQLVEEGKLSLNDSLSKWLPAYPNIDSTITIRQLLNHTSGLYDFVDNENYWNAIFSDPSRVWTPEEILLTFVRQPVFPKGTDWNYASTNYLLLRMIIQKITGSDISAVNHERFWTPLGLANSYTSMEGDLPTLIAHGWYDLNGDGTYDDFSSWPRSAWASAPSGEVWSTAEDLAKWARALFHNKTVISQTSLDQMLAFHSPCTGEEIMCAGYGLGVVKFNPQIFNGVQAYGHGGNAIGYGAGCIYMPNYGVCIGLMDNTEEGEAIPMSISNLVNVITNYLGKTE